MPAFALGEAFGEPPPNVREDVAQAVQKPLNFLLAAQKDTAQHQRQAALRMGFAIGKCERAAPGAPEHDPAFDAQRFAQALDVADQMSGGVVDELAIRCGAPGAALIEYDDAVVRRIEVAPMA